MPYIKSEDKQEYLDHLIQLGHKLSEAPVGHLTYCIFMLMTAFVGDKPSYQRLSAATGAAVDSADEFKRRVTNNYENNKILENGDVDTDFIYHCPSYESAPLWIQGVVKLFKRRVDV